MHAKQREDVMARVRIGEYLLTSDAHCWAVTAMKRKKETGEEYPGRGTYYGTMTEALTGLLHRKLQASEATSIEELRADLARIRAEILDAMGVRV